MFEGITDSLQGALSIFRSRGKLTEQNMQDGLAAVKQSLLEADVNYTVAQKFIDEVASKSVGAQVLKQIDPFTTFVGIVHQELIELMGPVDHSLHFLPGQVNVIMLCGLQGSGKTTTCGKLAKMLLDAGRKPLLVAADLQRPAAIEQLKVIGQQLGVPVHSEPQPTTAVKVCQNGVAAAKKLGDVSVVILDTAGRLHIDTALMQELEQIDRKLDPRQILLVSDAMTGQDAVNSAKAFNEALELDGVILTKLDGDSRGGAALSIKSVTGVPIKYIGIGEQLDKLEPFHPERMAGRILGMGDVASLFEKAQQQMNAEEMAAQQQKMLQGKFTLVDFKDMMGQIKKLGSIREIMKMIPGMGKAADMFGGDISPETEMSKIEGMINSMTKRERENPDIIDISRRRRIARGSGVEPSDVNKLLKDFSMMGGVMKDMAGMGMRQKMKAISGLANSGLLDPNAQMQGLKQRSKRGPMDQRKAEEKKKKQRKDAKKQRKKNRKSD